MSTWPTCICCGRPAQRLVKVRGETYPACYRCAKALEETKECPTLRLWREPEPEKTPALFEPLLKAR